MSGYIGAVPKKILRGWVAMPNKKKIVEYIETKDSAFSTNPIKVYYELVEGQYVKTEDFYQDQETGAWIGAMDPEKTYYEYHVHYDVELGKIKEAVIGTEDGDEVVLHSENIYKLSTGCPGNVSVEGGVVNHNGILYMSYRNELYSYDGTFWKYECQLPYNFYSPLMVSYRGELHILGDGYYTFSSGNEKLHYAYNGTSWRNCGALPINVKSDEAIVVVADWPSNNQTLHKIHLLSGTKHYSWDGSNWTLESTLPYSFSNGEAIFDPDNIRLVIFGGSSDSNYSNAVHYIQLNTSTLHVSGSWIRVQDSPKCVNRQYGTGRAACNDTKGRPYIYLLAHDTISGQADTILATSTISGIYSGFYNEQATPYFGPSSCALLDEKLNVMGKGGTGEARSILINFYNHYVASFEHPQQQEAYSWINKSTLPNKSIIANKPFFKNVMNINGTLYMANLVADNVMGAYFKIYTYDSINKTWVFKNSSADLGLSQYGGDRISIEACSNCEVFGDYICILFNKISSTNQPLGYEICKYNYVNDTFTTSSLTQESVNISKAFSYGLCSDSDRLIIFALSDVANDRYKIYDITNNQRIGTVPSAARVSLISTSRFVTKLNDGFHLLTPEIHYIWDGESSWTEVTAHSFDLISTNGSNIYILDNKKIYKYENSEWKRIADIETYIDCDDTTNNPLSAMVNSNNEFKLYTFYDEYLTNVERNFL